MSNPRMRDPSDPLFDPTDKYNEYKVDLHTNEEHPDGEFDAEHDGGVNDPESRHRDKLLDDFCDTHPGSPMCKVFDE